MAKNLIEKIEHNGELLAIIIRREYEPEGLEFLSEPHLGQQVAIMKHPAGHKISRHAHLSSPKQVNGVVETLLVLEGLIEAEFYNKNKELVGVFPLKAGDVAYLISGGHGFRMIEDSKIFEVKQGPYSEKEDKEKF